MINSCKNELKFKEFVTKASSQPIADPAYFFKNKGERQPEQPAFAVKFAKRIIEGKPSVANHLWSATN